MRNAVVIIVCGLVLGGGPVERATASVYGAQGLISVPSALSPHAGTVALGATTFKARREFATRPDVDWTWAAVTLDAGTRLGEVGATYLHRSGGVKSRDAVGGFAKLQLSPDSGWTPALALGADLIGRDLRTRQVYLAATHEFRRGHTFGSITPTVGGIYSWYRDDVKTEDAGVYGGLALGLAPHLSVVGEWRERTAGLPSDGLGAMLMWSASNYAIGIGALNTGNSDRQGFFVGAGFNVNTFD